MSKLKITTASGFKCEVIPEALEDIRVLESIVSMSADDTDDIKKMAAIFKVLTAILGEDGKEKLYKFVDYNVNKVSDVLAEIFAAIGENKKKS